MKTRKAPRRTKGYAFQVRITDDMKARFEALLESAEGVRNADHLPATRTDLVFWWLSWLIGLSPADQHEWIARYRDGHFESVKRGDKPPGGSRSPAVKGRHTVGRVVTLDERVKPRKVRPGTDGDEVDAEPAGRPLLPLA